MKKSPLFTTFTLISFFTFLSSLFATPLQAQITQTKNTQVPTQQEQSGGDFVLESVLDNVGGISNSGSSQGDFSLIHGFTYADIEGESKISTIIAVPEKRVPNLDNNRHYFLLEILPANTSYAAEQVLWSNASNVPYQNLTDLDGIWRGEYQVPLPGGVYDFYLSGLFTLRRRLPQTLLSNNTNLNFTAAQEELLTLPATATNSALLSGDAAILHDADASCGPSTVNCLHYSGDEWGDNYINGLDMSAIVNRLFQTDASSASILKEDLNGDGTVNGLDVSISFNNLFKNGD